MKKVYFIWGIVPVLAFKSWDNWGHQKGPFVYFPTGTPSKQLIAHELHHVKQFWCFGNYRSMFKREAAAYAVSCDNGLSTIRAAKSLQSSKYGFEKSLDECSDAIYARLGTGRLF